MNDSRRPFHDVGAVFPDDVDPVSVRPDESITTALGRMLEGRFSQMPVVDGDSLVGMFSLWSLAGQLVAYPRNDLSEMTVGDVLEPWVPRVTVNDPLDSVLASLDRHDAVMVVSPQGVQAIATAWDVLQYFYRVARPYVLLQEIELGLRDLLARSANPTELEEAARAVLAKKYGEAAVPARAEDMSFEDYRLLLTSRRVWDSTERIVGGTRQMLSTRLERVREVRNKVFHFRGDVTVQEYQALVTTREWLLRHSPSLRSNGGHDE